MNDLWQLSLRTACSRVLELIPERMRGSIDYHLGHHTVFYPQGGPMNGQTARLEIVRTLIIALRPVLFVEIGTFRGSTTEWLAQFGPRVVSLETSPRLHRFSELRLGARKNVRLMPGKSIDALRQLAGEGAFEGTVLFYLNGREQSHSLLREELEFIFTNCPSCLVVVDDFVVEGDVDYAFGHFGPDKALTTDYLAACELPNLAIFFPAVLGRRETGGRRGSVFLTASADVAKAMEATPALRSWRMLKDACRVDRRSAGPSDRAVGSSKPKLDDVTLCCIDCVQPVLAIRALQISRAQCYFAAALLFTHADIKEEGIEVRRIPPITDRSTAYSHFILRDLPAQVTTPFVLVTQWDGYVLDGARWEDGFRQFDYIGAPWNYKGEPPKVGNGGFSLRSRRLLEMVKDVAIPPGEQADDYLICNVWRPMLEQRGIRFADVATARRFSVELPLTEAPSFGFHGLFNFWRAVPAEELDGVLNSMSPAAARSRWLGILILEYARQRRWAEANSALTCCERQLGTAKTIQALTEVSPTVGAVAYDAIRRLNAREGTEAGRH